jgi:hypothetical protein
MNQPWGRPAHVGAHPFLAQVGALAQMATRQAAAHVGLVAHTGDSASDAQSSLSQAQNSLSACNNAQGLLTDLGGQSTDCSDCVGYASAAATAAQNADQSLPSQFQDTTGTIANAVSTIAGIDASSASASDAQNAVSAAQSAINQMTTDSNAYAASQNVTPGNTTPSNNQPANPQVNPVQPQPGPTPPPKPAPPPAPAPQQANILTALMDNWMLVAGVILAGVGIGYVVEKNKHSASAGGYHDEDHTSVTPAPSSSHALPAAGGSSAAHRAYGRSRRYERDYGYGSW